jgi:flagellar biosynthetic protein FlhB
LAEELEDQADRTEDPTPERRDEFRERGQVAVSREATSVFALAAATLFFGSYFHIFYRQIQHLLASLFQNITNVGVLEVEDFLKFVNYAWMQWLLLIGPLFLVVGLAATAFTFAQTKLNWSWQRVAPDFSRLNIMKGLANMMNSQALVNLIKGIAKTTLMGGIGILILYGEWSTFPDLIRFPMEKVWEYWGDLTITLFWSMTGLLLLIAAGDYLYTFVTVESKLKMTKQEVKEDYKKREVDPHVKAKIKRMQRDFSLAKIVKATSTATVVITNPTHYAVALVYQSGMAAPLVVAKGMDHIALNMREVANEHNVPIIENPPLARALYAAVEIGQFIPEALYRAVSEVIKYVFKLKGTKLPR